ncbi:BnaA05g30150D [Brassica napus]|uniref:BnaA05g30150D protein n=1 Tax=Brassica napus TaxID=3708 RepID=A0A078HC15_BRANA|nr:BnaA05g30150D [Brassica napus]
MDQTELSRIFQIESRNLHPGQRLGADDRED